MSDNSKRANIIQAVKFALFSMSAGIIQIGSFTIMKELILKAPFTQEFFSTHEAIGALIENDTYGPVYLVALLLSVIWNFTFNRKFTFKSAANIPVAMLKVLGFYLVFTPVSTVLGSLATTHIFGGSDLGEYVVLGITMLCNMVTEYLFCKFVVYRNQENTAVKK